MRTDDLRFGIKSKVLLLARACFLTINQVVAGGQLNHMSCL